MYSRQGLDAMGIISDMQTPVVPTPTTAMNTEYLSFIADFDYRFHPNWNAYIKGAYETAGVYTTLTIRVSGYAVRFNRLSKEQQLEVINRTFHGTI